MITVKIHGTCYITPPPKKSFNKNYLCVFIITDCNFLPKLKCAVQFFIFTVHFDSFRVEVNSVVKILLLIFIVALIFVDLSDCYKMENYNDSYIILKRNLRCITSRVFRLRNSQCFHHSFLNLYNCCDEIAT